MWPRYGFRRGKRRGTEPRSDLGECFPENVDRASSRVCRPGDRGRSRRASQQGAVHRRPSRLPKEAERVLGEFRADLLNGRHREAANGTCEAFRRKYESEVLSGLAQKTVKKADVVLDPVERLLKPKKLSDWTASRISRFIAELRDGKRSESTIAGYLAHLRAALSWAVGGAPARRAEAREAEAGQGPKEVEGPGTDRGGVREDPGDGSGGVRRASNRLLAAPGRRPLVVRPAARGVFGTVVGPRRQAPNRPAGRASAPPHPCGTGEGAPGSTTPHRPGVRRVLAEDSPQERTGRIFKPMAERGRGERLTTNRVTKLIAAVGEKAGVVVHVEARSGKKKYASAQDFRRAFGDRWALRVMPPVLMQLMRHESIDTTMRSYVGRSAQATAEVVWEAYERAGEQSKKQKPQESESLRDTQLPPESGPVSDQSQNQPDLRLTSSENKRPLPDSNRGWRICNPQRQRFSSLFLARSSQKCTV